MFKIGDFSTLVRVPVRTLRFYADIGLLPPAYIDPLTGYRYYSTEQLPRLDRILLLRDLGFSLEEIGSVLQDGITVEEMRGMLRLKQAETMLHIEDEQRRLDRIRAHLRQIELEGKMPDYDIVLKPVEPQTVVSLRAVVPTIAEMGPRCQVMFAALGGWVQQNHIRPVGPALSIYYNEEYTESDIDVETALIIDPSTKQRPAQENSPEVRELPGVPLVASTVHRGGYDHLTDAWRALAAWIETNGYTIAGPSRELYLSLPGEPAVAEIQYPVARQTAASIPLAEQP